MTYKRGQVEWALWRAFTLARSPGDGPPPIFKTRIKRLLDLDRDLDAAAFGASPPCDFAFVAPAEGGSGVEAQYTAFDVFCLALALDLKLRRRSRGRDDRAAPRRSALLE